MPELPVIQPPIQLSAPLIGYLARRMRTEMESEIETFGLRTRHLIALTILRQVGESSQADLAGALDVDRTNLVGLLNELEEEGLVERRRSPDDRRRHTVTLTSKGALRLQTMEKVLAAVEDRVLGALDHDQRITLHALLQRAAASNANAACAGSE